MAEDKDVLVRIDKTAHEKAKEKAKANGQTIKGYLTKLIEKDTGSKQQKPQQ